MIRHIKNISAILIIAAFVTLFVAFVWKLILVKRPVEPVKVSREK